MEPALCPKVEHAFQMIGKRWTGLIIYTLQKGPMRFRDIEHSIPISGRLLSERLKDLESENIVKREVFPEVPVRVEYSLTDKGKALQTVMSELESWADQYIEVEKEEIEK